MALTDVWWRGINGEWARTTASEADVTFVKSTDSVISHFKHSRGDTNKDCEDRSVNPNSAYLQQIPLSEFPLKLLMDKAKASI